MTTLTIYRGRTREDDIFVIDSSGRCLYRGKDWNAVREYDFDRVIVNEFVSIETPKEMLKEGAI